MYFSYIPYINMKSSIKSYLHTVRIFVTKVTEVVLTQTDVFLNLTKKCLWYASTIMVWERGYMSF